MPAALSPAGGGEERRPTLAVAAFALALAFSTLLLVSGVPDAHSRPGAWRGLGEPIGALLPSGDAIVHERVLRHGSGREGFVRSQGSLGGEVAWCATYALWFLIAWALLRRRAPAGLTLAPRRRDLELTLRVCAALVPLFVLGGLIGGLWAASSGGGQPLRAAVYGFSLPALGSPETAALPVLRMVILAPLAEEVLWRGVVYLALRRLLAPAPAAVAVALAFAAWHLLSGWGAAALLAQYGFALVACWLVERTGSLGAPILLHALGNAAAVGVYLVCMRWPEHVLRAFGA